MRLLMRALLASNAILLAALVWTQTRPQPPVSDVLRARLIELVDRHGEMRAQLQVAENGAGELRLRNSKGEIRTKLGASDDGAILLLLDGSVEPGVRLATDKDGPSLRLIDRTKGERVVAP
jgi:hypothetical protein